MRKIFSFTFLLLAHFSGTSLAPPAAAFDDDSTDNTRTLLEIRRICDNGRTLIDSPEIHHSCQGDSVYINRRNTGLYKNEQILTREQILDFKISRGGKVYYRTRFSSFLYDENGYLDSNRAEVVVYLVSSTGDVVYLNRNGDLFKNGKEVGRGATRIPLIRTHWQVKGKTIPVILNPSVSRTGIAVYRDADHNLYVSGIKINQTGANALSHKINSTGDVYFLDQMQRIYRNTEQLFDGRFNILEFRLNPEGKVAFLTDQATRNLFLEGRPLSAGAHRIVSFHFDGSGSIFYRDDHNRLWSDGRMISD